MIATAWFDDFSKLHLASGPTVSGKVERQADGGLLIELHPPKDSPDKRPDKYVALDPNKMTEKQLDDYLFLRRTTFATMRSLMNGLNDALIRIEIILPGKVERAPFAGKVTSENTVTFDITGKTLLEMLDRQMDRTPAQLKAEARKTGRLPAMNSQPEPGSFFGPLGKTPTIVTAPGVKPQFDYAAEVEAAKAATPQWIAKFKLGEIKWPDAKEAVKAP